MQVKVRVHATKMRIDWTMPISIVPLHLTKLLSVFLYIRTINCHFSIVCVTVLTVFTYCLFCLMPSTMRRLEKIRTSKYTGRSGTKRTLPFQVQDEAPAPSRPSSSASSSSQHTYWPATIWNSQNNLQRLLAFLEMKKHMNEIEWMLLSAEDKTNDGDPGGKIRVTSSCARIYAYVRQLMPCV